jgi:cytochrome b subunit of formate dehydrogenase
MTTYVVRFTLSQRIEHVVTMVLFVLLCLTGLPQKFYTHGWAQATVELFLGFDSMRWVHRICGLLLALSTIVHFANAFRLMLNKRERWAMVPSRQDFDDVLQQLRYYLGSTDRQPLYDRFDYKQKFEYWGLVMGNVIMVLTGLILFFPVATSMLLPGEVIPAAKMAHSNEGLMAFFVITIWHIFNAHLNPDVFPFDTGIFTGKVSRDRMLHEHPLELARMEGVPVEKLLGAGHGHGGGQGAAKAEAEKAG